MQVESKGQKRKYTNPPIPMAVSQPNRYWRIKKNLYNTDPTAYWKKRYWRRRITGKGSYQMNPEHSFGYRYGGLVGSKVGELLGGTAHNLISSVTGLGSYTVKKNIFMEGRLPQVVNQPSGGGTVIRFQEYLGDVITNNVANSFKIDEYMINPGNTKTFPFLSQIANNYEQYSIEGLLFEFKSTSADALNSTNTALGTVMMATQYDSLDHPFESKLDMLNYEYSTCIKPSESTMHMIECAPRQTPISELYVLSGDTNPMGSDPRLYFLGRFHIATAGFQGLSVNVGQIHVTYQVRLLKPKLYTALGNGNAWYYERISPYTDLEPLGAPPITSAVNDANNLNVEIDPTRILIPNTARRMYMVDVIWAGTNNVALSLPTVTATGASSIYALQIGIGTAAYSCSEKILVETSGAGGQTEVIFSTGGVALPTGTTTVRIIVTGVPQGAEFV